jgi:hypothetical protein
MNEVLEPIQFVLAYLAANRKIFKTTVSRFPNENLVPNSG